MQEVIEVMRKELKVTDDKKSSSGIFCSNLICVYDKIIKHSF
ncbi:hypothetical protein [Staphylococcus aureus]|nr:hypothetical protein [Staphylococcus aureus]